MTEIIVAVITGLLSIAGVVITNVNSNNKVQNSISAHQEVTDAEIRELTREVREHNNFARRMPVVEEQISEINKRIDKIENKLEEK